MPNRMNPSNLIPVNVSSPEDINISRRSSFNKGSPSINKASSINNIPSLLKRSDSKGIIGSSNAKLYCQEQAALLNEDGSNDSISSGSIEEDEGVKMNAKVSI